MSVSTGTGAGMGLSARLARASRKQTDALPYAFNATSVALVSRLRQDGQLNTVENVMHAIEQVSTLLTSHFDGHIKEDILNMCQHLKVYGACLEVLCKEQLDRAFVVFRNSSQDEDKLDFQSRVHLLELIELRANHWKGTDLMTQYYKKKTHQDNDATTMSLLSESASSVTFDSPTSAATLGPGEVMKASGKFSKPTRIPGKNYCKDEVVIRNADSGKVMGIKGRRVHMIEELSETIISFQRVTPGAKERLVQITGANESSINHAKQLIEDTIRRNASPVREASVALSGAGSNSSINSSASEDSALLASTSSVGAGHKGHTRGGSSGIGGGGGGGAMLLHSLSTGDATVGEYKYTVVVKGHTIKITGHNLDLVRMSKLVLDEFFSGEAVNGELYQVESLPQAYSPSISSNAYFDLESGDSQEPSSVDDADGLYRKPLANTQRPNKESGRYMYSMDLLARMAMSPYCLAPPFDWTRISCQHPTITRKIVEVFDADRYLSNRNTVANVLCTSASDESILSESSV